MRSDRFLLVRTPAPRPTESLFGYVQRLMDTNGYAQPHRLLYAAGFRARKLATVEFDVERLAKITGRPLALFENMRLVRRNPRQEPAPRPSAQYVLHGHEILKGSVRLGDPVYCPECVSERGFHEVHFDLRIVTCCDRHERRLLTKCPSCHERLAWYRPALNKCVCGASLDSVRDPAPQAELEISRLLRQIMLGEAVEGLSRARMPLPAMRSMSLRDLLQLLGRLSHLEHALRAETYRLRTGGRRFDVDEGANVAEHAAAMLADWPHRFHQFLDGFGRKRIADGIQAMGYSRQFEPLAKAFTHWGRGGGFLRDELVRFCSTKWAHGYVLEERQKGDAAANSTMISVAQLAQRSGVMIQSLRSGIRRGLLQAKAITHAASHKTVYLFDASEFDLDAPRERGLRGREAVFTTGIPASVQSELRRTGEYRVRRFVHRLSNYHSQDIAEFVERLIACAESTDDALGIDEWISLDAVFHRKKFGSAHGKAEVVRRILDCTFESRVVPGADLPTRRLFVRVRDVQALHEKVRAKAVPERVILREAIAILAADQQAVTALRHSGYLESTEENGRHYVTRASLEAFNSRYVLLSALAKQWKVATKSLLADAELSQAKQHVATYPRRTRRMIKRIFIDRAEVPMLESVHRLSDRSRSSELKRRYREKSKLGRVTVPLQAQGAPEMV